MTADEVLDVCRQAMTKPLNRQQQQIGIPREKHIGGKLMRRIAQAIGLYAEKASQLNSGPMVALSEPQLRTLESELGRSVCNSGDTLFGIILVTIAEDLTIGNKPYIDLSKE
jgi:hypothetical protein